MPPPPHTCSIDKRFQGAASYVMPNMIGTCYSIVNIMLYPEPAADMWASER